MEFSSDDRDRGRNNALQIVNDLRTRLLRLNEYV